MMIDVWETGCTAHHPRGQKEAFTQAQLEASRQAKLAQQQQQHQERQHKLVSGFAQLQHGSEKGGSKQERAHLDVADVAVVARVLEAHSDYDTLQVRFCTSLCWRLFSPFVLKTKAPPTQLRIGCDAVAVRRRYRELAFALHPDKCKVCGYWFLKVLSNDGRRCLAQMRRFARLSKPRRTCSSTCRLIPLVFNYY